MNSFVFTIVVVVIALIFYPPVATLCAVIGGACIGIEFLRSC